MEVHVCYCCQPLVEDHLFLKQLGRKEFPNHLLVQTSVLDLVVDQAASSAVSGLQADGSSKTPKAA